MTQFSCWWINVIVATLFKVSLSKYTLRGSLYVMPCGLMLKSNYENTVTLEKIMQVLFVTVNLLTWPVENIGFCCQLAYLIRHFFLYSKKHVRVRDFGYILCCHSRLFSTKKIEDLISINCILTCYVLS